MRAGSVVALFGNDNVDNMTVSRNAAGAILANGVAIPGADGRQHRADPLFGKDGNDTITLNETNGALPRADLFGGAGNDTRPAAPAATCSSAKPATTRCSARAASTSCSAATATTR